MILWSPPYIKLNVELFGQKWVGSITFQHPLVQMLISLRCLVISSVNICSDAADKVGMWIWPKPWKEIHKYFLR